MWRILLRGPLVYVGVHVIGWYGDFVTRYAQSACRVTSRLSEFRKRISGSSG